jgi:hypothetical protein
VRASSDCISRADECRELAKLAAKPEDWQHFLEMAATWDMLAKQRPSDMLAETWALAEARLSQVNQHHSNLPAKREWDVRFVPKADMRRFTRSSRRGQNRQADAEN